MKNFLPSSLVGLLACVAISAHAEEKKLENVQIATDMPALQRGAETVATTCVGCHSLKYIKYSDLLNLGIAKEKVDTWRGTQPLGSSLQAQMPEDAARAAFGGAAPPDLSLMAAAREGGGRYLYSYLVGYHMNEKGELTNNVFPETRMPDVLGAAGATDAQQRSDVGSKASDVSAFLVWAADPHAQERKTLGFYVLVYVALMTALLFLWKKQIWHDIDSQPKIK
jgi:ubiquinol-cytochrome c reductase cytochrome c1 subunit